MNTSNAILKTIVEKTHKEDSATTVKIAAYTTGTLLALGLGYLFIHRHNKE